MSFEIPKNLDYSVYFIPGHLEETREFFQKIVENFSKTEERLVMYADFSSLGIKEAGILNDFHNQRSDKRQFFFLYFDSITREAQNSLLKTLEDLKGEKYLFIASPRFENILETIKSRVFLINKKELNQVKEEIQKDVISFISMSEAKRVSFIDEMNKKNKKPASTRGDSSASLDSAKRARDGNTNFDFRNYARIFIDELERELSKKDIKKDIFPIIWQMRDYLSDTGSSPKIILETIALNL